MCARRFFVVDKIKSKEICLLYYPTNQIVAGYSSKPLQRKTFIAHKNTIMEVHPEDYDQCKRRCKESLERYE